MEIISRSFRLLSKIEDMTQVTTQVKTQVAIQNKILEYCIETRKKSEIAEYCGFKGMMNFGKICY